MAIAILCPGQGNQHARMFEKLVGAPGVAPILEKISGLTGLDPRDLSAAEASGALVQNRIAQVLVVGHSLALHAALNDLAGEIVVAGYSVGDLSAHAIAGCFSADEVLELASARGEAMDCAAPEANTPLGMTGVRGVSEATIQRATAGSSVEIALVNGRDHFVIGGYCSDLDVIEQRLAGLGAHIRRLPVSVASHTRHLEQAATKFKNVLARCAWVPPSHRLLSPIDGAPVDSKERAIESLSKQICIRLDWMSTMEAVVEYGATAAIELGAGHALTTMVTESMPSLSARAADEFKTTQGLSSWIARQMVE